jgi:hypothetical protein
MPSKELNPHFLIIRNKPKAFVTWYQYRFWFWSGLRFVPGIPDRNIINTFSYLFLFFFFLILWFVNFVKIFHFLSIFFSNSYYSKKNSQFLQIFFVATVRKLTKKNHSSVQNFFCFSTPDLFVMTVHVNFPSAPGLLHS